MLTNLSAACAERDKTVPIAVLHTHAFDDFKQAVPRLPLSLQLSFKSLHKASILKANAARIIP